MEGQPDWEDMHTLLFTSGSSGSPKAVAVGVKPFVEDIVGDPTERKVTQMPLTQLARRPGCVEGLRVLDLSAGVRGRFDGLVHPA